MLFLPTEPKTSPLAGIAPLRISREDISFETLPGRVVLLSVTVHNDTNEASEPTTMQINAAPLGVFLHSRRVGRVDVPSIAPHKRGVIKSAYLAPLLNVLSESEREEEHSKRRASLFLLQREDVQIPNRSREVLPTASPISQHTALSACLMGNSCWAGNFDVHVSGASAERHMKGGIRLKTGTQNMGYFQVGDGKRDRYQFEFYGDEHSQNWNPTFLNLDTGRWHSFAKQIVLFSLSPPKGAVKGCIAAGVTRESTGKGAMVEFGFGTNTIPPGCYVGR